MRGVKRLGWMMLGVLTAVVLPCTGHAADKSSSDKALEDRVRALERKVDQQQQGEATEQKSVTDRVNAIEKEVKDNEKTLLEKTGISIHGMVAVDYLFDINRPDAVVNGVRVTQPFLRVFENEKNSFTLNLANLHFERAVENQPGFVIDLDFGKTADVVNNTTFFGRHCSASDVANGTCATLGAPITGNGTDFFDVRQFYLTYTVPVGSGIKLKAGRFVTLAGAEVIKSYNNFNYNITNSILFGFAIPFTHTGLMASYAFTDQVSLDLGVVNGWDSVADNNDGKSLHSGLTLAFDPHITFYQTVMYGPEQTGRTVLDNNNVPLVVHAGRSKRLLLTSLLTIKPIDPLTLIIDYNYGNDSDSVPRDGLLRTAQWQGVAGYIIYNFTDDLSATLRAEVFDDTDGARTGARATYSEVSPTITYKIADGLFWRNEYRHDESDTKKVFAHEGNFVRGQDTIATELIYAF